jgi:hypothetical protein
MTGKYRNDKRGKDDKTEFSVDYYPWYQLNVCKGIVVI